MGEEKYFTEPIKLLKNYQVNVGVIKSTENPEVIFMHCLPSIHDNNTEVGKMVY